MPPAFQFDCPHCQARLRARDRKNVGREMACPECGQPILLKEADDGGILATAAKPAPRPRMASSGRWPIRIVVGATILMCLGLLVFVLREQPAGTQADARPAPASDPAAPKNDGAAPGSGPDPNEPEPAKRMRLLGEWLTDAFEGEGAFPLATEGVEDVTQEDRLSWLARIARQSVADGTPPPSLSLAWNAPENDRFVRRRLPPFQIPGLAAAGPDGYPAGHFVGVAGVGADGAALPKTHPRAGIFGWDRRTTEEDVRDGLSNTFLVLGREEHLHSWADGQHSIRALTAEPYVRGPDGFGTGQPEGMHVLLADGSVKFLSAATASVVFRRYAAMADGQPLDPMSPGDPLDAPAPVAPASTSPPPAIGATGPGMPATPGSSNAGLAADPPILPQLAPDRPMIDFERALAQRLREYRVPTPVPAEEVLYELQEIAAVPLDWSALEAGENTLTGKTLALSMQNTTVEALIDAVARELSAKVVRDRRAIRLVPLAAPSAN